MTDLNPLLAEISAEIDIPREIAEEAILEYEGVGAWLCDEASSLREYSPEVYPQGSFRLGTPVYPFRRADGFDIDLVCPLALKKEQTTQAELKALVGDRLKESATYAARIEERRRCWSLKYRTFHLDVLPAIPEAGGAPNSILITDTELHLWQFSNPIEYANWFFARMGVVLRDEEVLVAKALGVEIEEVPRWTVRTPLQRAVQLLKRHRDVAFELDAPGRPVSILLTTLAGRAYHLERDLFSAVLGAVRRMPQFIENREGRWWVENPAHPEENFADKWNENAELRPAFLQWLSNVEQDLLFAQGRTDQGSASARLASAFGTKTKAPNLPVAVPTIGDLNHAETPKWPENLTEKVSVKGAVYNAKRGRKKLWELSNRPVPKRIGLRFSASTTAPAPYEIFWRVTNTGQEAASAGQLRGGFEPSEAGNVRWETTAYTGTHVVEAFVVKDGKCVARSERKYVRVR
jgi:hypothetical protein